MVDDWLRGWRRARARWRNGWADAETALRHATEAALLPVIVGATVTLAWALGAVERVGERGRRRLFVALCTFLLLALATMSGLVGIVAGVLIAAARP